MNRKPEKSVQREFAPRPFHMEADSIRGTMTLILCEVRHIDSLDEGQIFFRCGGGKVSVQGDHLLLSIFGERRAQVCGKIREVRFFYGET